MNLDFPYRIDNQGRTAAADEEKHIRDMIEQLLFTMPGERINRPEFGCGLMQLVFAPAGDELAATTQFLVQGALQQWMGELIRAEDVSVMAEDGRLRVTVSYLILKNQRRTTENFEFNA